MGRRARSVWVAVVALVVAGAVVPAVASAEDCPDDFFCVSVTVPLDRSGATPGTLELPIVVQRGTGPILVALGGGPGQGMVSLAPAFGPFLATATGHRIAFFDQRGTGATALRCPSLQRLALTDFTVPPAGTVETCGERLGAQRSFYSTTATVADLEDVRIALGADRIAVLGVSYGTYVAERYARAHPDRVSALVLDSVVPQEDVDILVRDNLRTAGHDLRDLCAGDACRRVTADPALDLRTVVRRANERPIRGVVRTGLGPRARARVTLDGPALFDAMTTWASFRQDLFGWAPAAIAQAREGHPHMLMRLAELASRANAPARARQISWGLHTATLCADMATPWGGPATDPATRAGAADAAVAALAPGTFAPFDATTSAHNGVLETCRRWPATIVAPPPEPGPLPRVPTLMLNGAWDMSTPVAGAREEAARSSTEHLVIVPNAGHSVLTSVPCAQVVLRRFFRARPPGRACAGNPRPDVFPLPRRVRDVPGARRERALAVAGLTIADAQAAVQTGPFGGLYGGTVRQTRDGTLVLRSSELVRGAPVTGRIRARGTVHVGGRLDADVTFRERRPPRVRLR
jgi:pimeloyl-ACP methyl ester carboxylesterase